MKIVLIGYMGSGKSVIGSGLAKVLSTSFYDLDAEIEKEESLSIASVFVEKGEIYFRKKERATLLRLLVQNNQSIIATGGGTPCYGNMMETILSKPDVIVIYLKASLETLTQRLSDEKEKRPLIAHLKTEVGLNDFIRKHLFERNFYYFQAERTINVDDKTVVEIVEEIVVDLF
ncbi:MAG: shikimate kinase [Planctomycetota bacterium]|jgi:shikimate kinase